MAVVTHEGAAAAGGLHDGFGARFDGGPPGIDVAPGTLQALLLGIEVVVHRATAAGLVDGFDADAQEVQKACGGGIGIGRQCRLHAAFQHQHPAYMARCRALAGWGYPRRQLALERGRQQRAQGLATAGQGLEQCRARHHRAQALAQQALAERAGHLLLDHGAADVQQVMVSDP
ncbi:hypothetical protein D3C81_322280 [compost metagenome]